jgi:hypothetical protein
MKKAKFLLVILMTAMLALTSTAYAGNLDLGKYSWEGEWESNWVHMVITQIRRICEGRTYTHDQGKISGTVSGNTLREHGRNIRPMPPIMTQGIWSRYVGGRNAF